MTLLQYAPMRASLSGVLLVFVVAGCSRDRGRKAEGLPPASEWSQQDPTSAMMQMSKQGELPAPPPGMTPQGAGGDTAGGLPPGHPAIGGGDPSDPHAGMDMGGGAASVPPIPGPDPDRAIDPTRFAKGTIKLDAKARDRAKAGLPLFVMVKRVDASGAPTGMPLAAEKLTWQGGDLPFELTERDQMIQGTELTGDVMVMARVDQDGDAVSKQPGDVTGQTRVTLPADNIQLVLDTVIAP